MYLKKDQKLHLESSSFSTLQGTSRNTQHCCPLLLSLPHYCVLSHNIVLLYNQECFSVHHIVMVLLCVRTWKLRDRSLVQFCWVFRVGRLVGRQNLIPSNRKCRSRFLFWNWGICFVGSTSTAKLENLRSSNVASNNAPFTPSNPSATQIKKVDCTHALPTVVYFQFCNFNIVRNRYWEYKYPCFNYINYWCYSLSMSFRRILINEMSSSHRVHKWF